MEITLGYLLTKSPPTGERALKEILLKEGIAFIPGKFPLAWAKEVEGGVEIVSFYPALKCSAALWVGKELIPHEKSNKTVIVEGIREEEFTKVVTIPLALYKGADKVDIKVPYKKIFIQATKKRKFANAHAELSFLFSNAEVTYVTYLYAQCLYYHLGFPLKHFDNLGNFWKGGLLYDLVTASYKKIA